MDSRILRQVDDQATIEQYVAPQIELVLTSDEIEREVLYAGGYTGDDPWTDIPA